MPVTAAAAAASKDVSPWPRLRSRFAMHGCDYRPDVQRWARYYTKGTRAFTASLRHALPLLLLVTDEIVRRDLPGEFALLPFVESNYRPLPSDGGLPAGMWQLVPATARAAGLVITAGYDARLDALASTTAALDLISRYRREFADWRLADMAFNSGEFRVRRLLGGRDARSLSAQQLSRLAFNPVTHEHLDRLLALACIVDDPQRFGIVLPEPGENDVMQIMTLDAGMDLRLAARLSGLGIDDLRHWNAGYRRNRMPADVAHRLLLPATRVTQFRAAAEAVPIALWSDWHQQRAARTSSIDAWALQLGVPAGVLATANAVAEHATIVRSTQLLLPGREPEPIGNTRVDLHEQTHVHIVVAGDTLAQIAQHYAIPLRQLRQLNPGPDRLRPGQQLHLARDTD